MVALKIQMSYSTVIEASTWVCLFPACFECKFYNKKFCLKVALEEITLPDLLKSQEQILQSLRADVLLAPRN